MEHAYSAKLSNIIKELNVETIYSPCDLDSVKISSMDVNRPGLQLAGFFEFFDSSRIERVEVIKGPASVLYGSDAIGGVVNIITKKGGAKPIEGEAWLGYNGASSGFSEGMAIRGNI